MDKLNKFLSFFWLSSDFRLLPPLATVVITILAVLFVLGEFQPTQL